MSTTIRKVITHAPELDRPIITPRPKLNTTAPTPPLTGPQLWARWHVRALKWPGTGEPYWIEENILAHLPCAGCRIHVMALMDEMTPGFGIDGWDYFAWTVALHNAINRKLGKREMSVEEARGIWKMQPPPPVG